VIGLSVIIPVYNEAGMINRTLPVLLEKLGRGYDFEVIIIDNGSNDETVEIVKSIGGVDIITIERNTVAKARNIGAEKAIYDILYFIDADVLFTEEISKYVLTVLEKINDNCSIIAGDRYDISDEKSLIEKCWFGGLYNIKPAYINGGNLFVSKVLFSRVGGFRETLETGEDYQFCHDVKMNGGIIEIDKKLRVVHLGNPKSITSFIKREIWHGAGDSQSLKTIVNSKPAVVSLLILFATISFVVSIFISSMSLFSFSVTLILFLLTYSVFYKFKKITLKCFFVNLGLMYMYYISRSYSILRNYRLY
jgi:glycosyltransferase involved in cell wall biosynthesis